MRAPIPIFSALVLAWAGSAGVARAQTAAAEDAPARADNPPIAAPGDDAGRAAKPPKLTPLVPSPNKPGHPAYQLYAEIDLPVLGVGLAFEGARFIKVQKAFCAPLCDPGDLNAIDRTTAGYWSPGWQSASNYGLLAVGVGAATLLFVDEGFLRGINDLAVVAESTFAGIAIASMVTLATGRPRPFLYGDKAPLSARNSADAGLSFLSSHSVAAFAIATSTFVTMRRLHPGSKATWIVMAAGGAMATFVATARVLGGMHFISDAVGGAMVGTSVGVLVPALHAIPVAIVPVAGDGQRGIVLSARF
jgi:membrane-associated phospholipid phosphatase